MLLEFRQVVEALQKKGIEFEHLANRSLDTLCFLTTKTGSEIKLSFGTDKKMTRALIAKPGEIYSVKNFSSPEPGTLKINIIEPYLTTKDTTIKHNLGNSKVYSVETDETVSNNGTFQTVMTKTSRAIFPQNAPSSSLRI